MVNPAGSLAGTLLKLGEEINDLRKVLSKTVTLGETYQKSTLSLGLGITEVNEKLAPTMEGLRGSVEQKLNVGIHALKSGLDGNLLGINRLANQQEITGQNWQQTLGVFSQLKAIGGLQNKELNSLAEVTRWAGETYGVQSEKLVDAMGSLARSQANIGLLGGGGTILEAFNVLGSQLGPEYLGTLANVMNFIFSDSVDTYQKLALLNMGNLRDQLREADGNLDATLKLFIEAVHRGGSVFEDIQSNSWEGLIAATGLAGEQGKETAIIHRAIQAGMRDTQEANRNYADSLKVVFSEIMNPVKEFFIRNYETFKTFGQTIGDITSQLTNKVGAFLKSVDPDLIRGTLLSLAIGISTAIDYTVYQVKRFGGVLEKANDVKEHIGSVQSLENSANAMMERAFRSIAGGLLPANEKRASMAREAEWLRANIEAKNSEASRSYLSDITKSLMGMSRSSPLSRIAEATEEVAENTRSIPSSPDFLSFSDQSLAMSMRSILGINEDKGLSLLQELVDIAGASLKKEAQSLPTAQAY